MPIFEYRCDACEEETGALVRRPADEPSGCEACGGRLRRVLSRTHVSGRSAADESALRAGSAELLERPERLGQAVRALAGRAGTKLSGERLDGMMHRLAEAKRKA